ncbi:MAG: recombinase family protein [Alishewanella aestuarii]
MKVARVYQRVSTKEQDLTRQSSIVEEAKLAGFYVAGVYREKASGAKADRPELLRMIDDLQPGEVVISEKMDRISRLPLKDAEQLICAIKAKGAKLAVPGVVDLSDLVEDSTGVTRIVLEAIQDMLLKVALQTARDDYEDRRKRQQQGIAQAKKDNRFTGRRPDTKLHERIIALRLRGESIADTAHLTPCSKSTVKRVWSTFQSIENKNY